MKTSKILWDFNIYIDRAIHCCCPDILLIHKEHTGVKITDVAVLWDANIESKYREKVDHYKDLAIELSRLWQKQVTIIPIIVRSLPGCVKSNLYKALKDLSIEAKWRSYMHTLQNMAISPKHISSEEFLISTGSTLPSGFPYPVQQTCTCACTVKLERNNNNNNNNNNWELWWWFRSAQGRLCAPFKTNNKGLLGSRSRYKQVFSSNLSNLPLLEQSLSLISISPVKFHT